MLFELIIKSFVTVISALCGGLILFSIKMNHRKLCVLISLSAGSLFGAALFSMIHVVNKDFNTFILLASLISGYFLFWIISKYYFHICPACSASHFDEQTTKKFSEIILLLFTALSFHSFLDGLAIYTGLVNDESNRNSIFAAVLTHKFPEGLALASLMLGANYKKVKIIYMVLLIEMTTIVGSVFGYYFVSNFSSLWLSLLEAHIAGGFIFLSTHAVLGELLKNHKGLVLVSFMIGIIFIFAVSFII